MTLKYLAFSLIIIFFIFNCLTTLLSNPPIWPDEAYIADITHNYMQTGQIKSDLWGNMIPGASEHIYWYPPLLFNILAVWFRVFGFSIEAMRQLSVTIAVLCLFNIYLLIKQLIQPSKTGQFIALVSVLLISTDMFFLKGSKIGRPDIYELALGLSALNLFLYTINLKSNLPVKKWLYFAVGGIVGLSTLVHIMGWIFVAAIGIQLGYLGGRKFYRSPNFYFYLLGALSPAFIWFLSWINNFSVVLTQLYLASNYQQFSPSYVLVLLNYGNWKQIFLVSFYLIVSVCLVFYFKIDFKKNLALWLCLPLFWLYLLLAKIEWYLILPLPFFYVLLAIVVDRFLSKWPNLLTKLLLGGLCLVILVINLSDILHNRKLTTGQNFQQFGELVDSKIPPKSTVFKMTTPDLYFSLIKSNVMIKTFPVLKTAPDELLKVLDQSDYVIIDNDTKSLFYNYLITNYLLQNEQATMEVELDPYKAKVVRLKSKTQRIEI